MRRLSTVYEENKAQIARILDLFGEGFTAMTEISVKGERFSLFCMRGVEGAVSAAELIRRCDGNSSLISEFAVTYSLDKMIEAIFRGDILIIGESLSDGALGHHVLRIVLLVQRPLFRSVCRHVSGSTPIGLCRFTGY